MDFTIALLRGDGVGPEVVAQGVRVLEAVGRRYGHAFRFQQGLIGGCAIDETGNPLPPDTLALCRQADAVLLGAVGGPKWDDPKAPTRPEAGLLAIRQGLGLFANLRPTRVYSQLRDATPLKPQALDGVDFIVVRELTGGLYFARPKRRGRTSKGRYGIDTLRYSEAEVERVLRAGFELARSRRRKLTSVDKANVLESSRLWREIATELARDYPDVTLEHMLVDTCAMNLVRQPSRFDVIVTENMFGDILTDEAAVLAGSMGMSPSASLAGLPRDRQRTLGLYEPVHGSAPDIAGKDVANPIGTILSVAMMLRYSLGLPQEAAAVERAVEAVLSEGYRTADIMSPDGKKVRTKEMGELIARKV